MQLTVCVGTSGSGQCDIVSMKLDSVCTHIILFRYPIQCDCDFHQGKTTFLEDVHKMHKCTYIRQYYNLWSFIAVLAITNFDQIQASLFHSYLSLMCKSMKNIRKIG